MPTKTGPSPSRAGGRLRAVARGSKVVDHDNDDALDLDPRSAYELLTRQMVAELGRELREIRMRVNGLIFATLGAVLADAILRLVR